MTKLAAALMVAAILVTAGCSPGAEQVDPSPTLPTTVVEPPSPTLSPQWTEEEQELIDAVDDFLRVSFEIGQDPTDTGEWNRIYEVAGEPTVANSMDQWTEWVYNGWHEAGTSSFEPESIAPGMGDHLGKRFYIRGCYTASYIVDANGDRVFPNALEQMEGEFRVLRLEDGDYRVLENVSKGEPCVED
jgi:hypothetical protein